MILKCNTMTINTNDKILNLFLAPLPKRASAFEGINSILQSSEINTILQSSENQENKDEIKQESIATQQEIKLDNPKNYNLENASHSNINNLTIENNQTMELNSKKNTDIIVIDEQKYLVDFENMKNNVNNSIISKNDVMDIKEFNSFVNNTLNHIEYEENQIEFSKDQIIESNQDMINSISNSNYNTIDIDNNSSDLSDYISGDDLEIEDSTSIEEDINSNPVSITTQNVEGIEVLYFNDNLQESNTIPKKKKRKNRRKVRKMRQNDNTQLNSVSITDQQPIPIGNKRKREIDPNNNYNKKNKKRNESFKDGKKKTPCLFFIQGRCAKGSNCEFRHEGVRVNRFNHIPCQFFLQGICRKGDDCGYSHDLSQCPCKFYHLYGSCQKGNSCPWSHKEISNEVREDLLNQQKSELEKQNDKLQEQLDDKKKNFIDLIQSQKSIFDLNISKTESELTNSLSEDNDYFASIHFNPNTNLNTEPTVKFLPFGDTMASNSFQLAPETKIQPTFTPNTS